MAGGYTGKKRVKSELHVYEAGKNLADSSIESIIFAKKAEIMQALEYPC